jgi:hypothetical protein
MGTSTVNDISIQMDTLVHRAHTTSIGKYKQVSKGRSICTKERLSDIGHWSVVSVNASNIAQNYMNAGIMKGKTIKQHA